MIMMHGVTFILLLVCLNTGLSKPTVEEESKLSDVESSDSNKRQTSSIPSPVESRFFDLGGVINQLFSGFNQGGVGGRPGLNLPSNSQFYPGGGGVPTRNFNPLIPNNRGTPSDINFNQQGSINNINQPEQCLNQPGSGQNPANLNGNLINGGGNQRRQPGNFQNSGFQQSQPSRLDGQQGQGRPEYDIGAFEYPGRRPANANQGTSNFNNNNNYPSQNNNGPSLNQYPNGQDIDINPVNQNGRPPNRRPQNPSNQAQKPVQQQPNPNNKNQYPNAQQQGNNAINIPKQGFPANQYQQGANNRGQNNPTPPQRNVNNNLPPNVNEQGPNLNNNRPNQQVPQSQTNQKPQGGQRNPGQAAGGYSNGAISFPAYDDGDDDLGQSKGTQAATIITTMPPTTASTGNSIRGKPVLIPMTTVSPDQVVFINSDTPTASQKECVQNCPTSSEYNPVCGTDNVSYFNPGRLLCARNCGIRVFESRKGNCARNK